MQPMSYNAWLYTLANPVKYFDPTGYFPMPDGFLVDGFVRGRVFNVTFGLGFAGLNLLHGLKIPLIGGGYLPLLPNLVPDCLPGGDLMNVVGLFGKETVYDFVHGEKQEFNITYVGTDFLQVVGAEVSFYEGLASGFRNVSDVSNYQGFSVSVSTPIGFSLSLLLVEGGIGAQSNIAVNRPGVDSVTFCVSIDGGIGMPGPGLEEGALGSYLTIVIAEPVGSKVEFDTFSEMENELRQAGILGGLLVDTARAWWALEE